MLTALGRSQRAPRSEFAQIHVVLLRGLVQPQLADGAERARRDLELDGAVQLLGEELLRLQVGELPVRVVLVGESHTVGVVRALARDVADAAHRDRGGGGVRRARAERRRRRLEGSGAGHAEAQQQRPGGHGRRGRAQIDVYLPNTDRECSDLR